MPRYTPPSADPAIQAAHAARIAALEGKPSAITRVQRLALTPVAGMKVIETDTGLELNYIANLGWRTGAGVNPDTADTGVL